MTTTENPKIPTTPKFHLLLYWGDTSAIARDEGTFSAMTTAEYEPFLKELHQLHLKSGKAFAVGLSMPSVALNTMSKTCPRIIQLLTDHISNGIIELYPSTAFKVILPLFDAIQTQYQVHSGKLVYHHHFTDLIDPHIFFPPELAIDRSILRILQSLGIYKTFVSESSLGFQLKKALPYFTSSKVDRRVMLIPVNLNLSLQLLELSESSLQSFRQSVLTYTKEMGRSPVLILEERLMAEDFTMLDKLELLINEGFLISKPTDILVPTLPQVAFPQVFPRTISYEVQMLKKKKKMVFNPPDKELFQRWRDHVNPLHLVLWHHLDLIHLVTNQFFKAKRDEQLPDWFWDVLGAFDVSIFELAVERPIRMNEIMQGFERQRRALTSLVAAYSDAISENLRTVALELSNKISERLILIITELLFSQMT